MSSNEVASLILTQNDEVTLKYNLWRATKLVLTQNDEVALKYNLWRATKLVLTQNDEVALKYNLWRATKFGSDDTKIRNSADEVALGQNQTRNFVARHKLYFNATSSLCVRIILATSLLTIS